MSEKITLIVPLTFLIKNRKQLKKVVLIGGAFDIMHVGHLDHIKKAKSLGDTLIVHITGDRRIREKKGSNRPIFNQKQRAHFVSSIKFVDYVFIYNGRHYDPQILSKIKPNIIFFNEEAYNSEVKNALKNDKNFKGKVVVGRDKKISSTSKILEIMKENNRPVA